MSHLTVAAEAIRSRIKFLVAEQRKLEEVAEVLATTFNSSSYGTADGQTAAVAKKLAKMALPGLADTRHAKQDAARTTAAKRKRLKPDTAKDISEKVVKAAKAYGSGGAARSDIVKYLDMNGYRVGHHYTDPILNRMIGALVTAGEIVKQGDRSKARYLIKPNHAQINAAA
ncbi:MAG: hypothetical protein JWM57_1546 [Phycisphaerales bacterium]|nr:hypothetical protein [Phycisphaerales bacterium]